jgi:hypothetical protein
MCVHTHERVKHFFVLSFLVQMKLLCIGKNYEIINLFAL